MKYFIKIKDDFSDTPGGRYIKEGEFSGEEFREKILLPAYVKAQNDGEKLTIDFDDCYGYGTSFLEEAFGGLVREHGKMGVLDHLILISREDETIPGLIKKYIQAEEKKRGSER